MRPLIAAFIALFAVVGTANAAITKVGCVSASGATITLPAGWQAGDLAVVFAFRDGSTTAPTLATGFTSINTRAGTSCSARLAYRILQTGDASFAFTNASEVEVIVLRGHSVTSVIAKNNVNSGASTTLSYPALTGTTATTSWIVGFGGHRSATNVNTATASPMTLESVATVNSLGMHSRTGVSSFSATTWSAVNANSGWITGVVEVLACTSPVSITCPGAVSGFVNSNSTPPYLAYPFNEGTGTTANDVIGNKDGTFVNSPTWVAGHFSDAGHAVKFDGGTAGSSTSDYIDLPDGIVSNLNGDYSISFWINLGSNATSVNWAKAFDFGNTATTGWVSFSPVSGNTNRGPAFEITLTDYNAKQVITSSASGTGSQLLSTGTWHHLVVIVSGTTGTLYVDNANVATNNSLTIKPSALGNTAANYFGKAQSTSDPYLNASLDDFRIYDYALTSTQVSDLYNATTCEASSDLGTVSLGTPTSSGGCGTVTYSNDAEYPLPLGANTITWTATDGGGATSTCSQSVIVIPSTASFGGTLANQCVNNTTYTLTGGLPAGGTYSGTGVTGDNFNASVAGVGTFTITYTYTYTYLDGNSCTSTATNTITVIALPTANAGTAVSTCSSAGAVNVTTGASATNYSSVNWTSSGTGSWTNQTSLTLASYTPSAADITAGSVTLTLTANGNSPCGNATSTKTLTIVGAATSNAGTAVSTCSTAGAVNVTTGASATNYSSVNWTSSGTGSWTSQTSLTLASYTPSAADITAGSVTLTLTANGNSPCGNATSTKTLTITGAATSNAGTAVSTCSTAGAVNVTTGASATNYSSVNWTSSGTGSWTNQTSLTLASYTPSAADITAGSVTLTLTSYGNSPCGNATSQKTLSITTASTSYAGPDGSSTIGVPYTVSGASASNYAGILWTKSGGTGTFTGTSTLTPTYTPAVGDPSSITFTLTAGGNSPCGDASDDMVLTINSAPLTASWSTTAASTNWFAPGNWAGGVVPGSVTSITIPGGASNYPTLTSDVTCQNITIEDGGSFIGTEHLTVTGTSLAKRNVSADAYHFLSSPVNSTTFGDVFPNNQNKIWAQVYDEPTGTWVNQTVSGTLVPGIGYSVWIDPSIGNQTALFSGTFNSLPETETLSLLNTSGDANKVGWNLLGNPFTSGIDWDNGAWHGGNVDGSVYIWDGAAQNYKSWNGSTGSLTGGVVPPQNGFFVKTNTNNSTITIPLAARVHTNISYYKDAVPNTLQLGITGNGYHDDTYIQFTPGATSGFDASGDAYKLWGVTGVPQIYSIIPGDVLSINALPSTEANPLVSLGLKVGAEATYTLTASGMNSFDPSVPVRLDDLKLGITRDLRLIDTYTFNAAPGDAENRFNIRFYSPVGMDEPVLSEFYVYANQGKITVNNAVSYQGIIYVYNTAGQLLRTQKMEPGIHDVAAFPVGVYIVKAVTGKTIVSHKVVLF